MEESIEAPPLVRELACEHLQKLEALRKEGLRPYQESLKKREILCGFLAAVGEATGATLKPMHQTYGSGEVLVSAVFKGDSPHAHAACGHFGETLAAVINLLGPRCGEPQYPRTTMIPESGWCYVEYLKIELAIRQLAT